MPFLAASTVLSWFERLVERAIERRIAECIPLPWKAVDVRLNGVTFSELNNPVEPSMPVKSLDVTLAADAPFGYSATPITFVNKAGNPLDPGPDPSTVTVTASDPSVVADAHMLDGSTLYLLLLDSAPVGATADVRISAVETGEDDDAVIHVTVGADRLGSVSVEGVGFSELTAAP